MTTGVIHKKYLSFNEENNLQPVQVVLPGTTFCFSSKFYRRKRYLVYKEKYKLSIPGGVYL